MEHECTLRQRIKAEVGQAEIIMGGSQSKAQDRVQSVIVIAALCPRRDRKINYVTSETTFHVKPKPLSKSNGL